MSKTLTLFVCLLAAGLIVCAERQFKTQAEYDAYNEVVKDLTANNTQKAIADLDVWKQKFPDSDFRDDRTALYVQTWATANQPAKAVDAAAALIGKELVPAQMIKFLYTVAVSIQKVPNPTAAQLATASEAARQLAVYDVMPEGAKAEAWAQARHDMEAASKAALQYIAIAPATDALNRKDCDAAEKFARKAIDDFPQTAQAAWSLGGAWLCQKKAAIAIFEFARAASLDPQPAMVAYLEKLYKQYHGEDPDNFEQLKSLAKSNPVPPAGFELKSSAEITDEFAKKHPELTLWLSVKAALQAANGESYFTSDLKDSSLPPLIGVLVAATPECRPKELRVAVREPGSTTLDPQIVLKLEKPLTGKLELNSDLRWSEAVPSAFSPSPFLLTMDIDPAKIEGLQLTPCPKK